MRTHALLLATLVSLGCGFHNHPPVPMPARGPARDSLLELDQSRADSLDAHGAIDGMLSLLGTDVVFLRAGLPAVYGKAATRAVFASGSDAVAPGTIWQPLGGRVSLDVNSGYTYGIVGRVAVGRSRGPAVRLERYIAFWQRPPARPWRIIAYAELNAPASADVPIAAEHAVPPALQLSGKAAEATASIRAADSLFADLADRMGVAYAFSNTVAETGVVVGQPRLAVGPDAVRELFDARPAGTSLTWRPAYAVVAGSLDLGFTVGETIFTGRGPSGAAVQRFGKYLRVWERQKDGTWKFVVDGANSNR
jgi:ketosteroid isomerase-like protein